MTIPQLHYCFNRTSVVLKPSFIASAATATTGSFNRTSVVLKQFRHKTNKAKSYQL